MAKRNPLPAVASDGAVMAMATRKGYARQAVLTAFEMIGGVEGLADWAEKNKTEFYKSLFAKTITKESELTVHEGVEAELDKLEELDDVIDAEYEYVDDDDFDDDFDV